MKAEAGIVLEGDGKRVFTGHVGGNTSAGANGNGNAGGITDLRWSDEQGGIEAKTAGAWALKVPFVAFGD